MKPAASDDGSGQPPVWWPGHALLASINNLFEQVQLRIHGLACIELTGDSERPWHRQTHGDPFWRLYWNQHDGAELHHERGVLELAAAAIHLIPPGCVYHSISPRRQRHLFLHLELQTLPLGVQQELFPAPLSLPAAGFQHTAPLLQDLLHGQDGGDPLALTLQARGLVAAALGLALTGLSPERQAQLRHLLEGRDPIRPALLAIAADPAHPWRVADLARRCGLSVRGFHAACRRSLGMAPSRHVQSERLRHAASLLLTSAVSVEQIALDSGFHDRAHLTRQFRRHYGTTPHAYRRTADLLIGR